MQSDTRQQQEEMEIDLKEILFELLAHWKMIILSTVLVAAIAFVVSKFIMVPQYESTAQLYVLSKSTSITSLTDLQMGTNLTKDYIVVVAGRPVIDQVIENLNLDEDYASLSVQVKVSNPSDSRILEITVIDPDPQRAKRIADEIATVAAKYIHAKMDQDPPNIIQAGYADGAPVSPSIAKNTLIGALLGFVLAAAIVIISFLLNDNIYTTEDIEKKLGLQVLGTLPEEEAEFDGNKSKKKKSASTQKTAVSQKTTAAKKTQKGGQ